MLLNGFYVLVIIYLKFRVLGDGAVYKLESLTKREVLLLYIINEVLLITLT